MGMRRIYTENPTIISRTEARAAGLDVYFTGKPCRNGHLFNRRVHTTRCVECSRHADDRRDSPPEQRNVRERILRLNKKDMYLLANARRRANKAGREFSITIEDVVIPEKCPCCQQRLESAKTPAGGAAGCCPSIDRVDSLRGYTPDNIAIICMRCNTLKRNGSVEDFENIVAYMRTAAAISRARKSVRLDEPSKETV